LRYSKFLDNVLEFGLTGSPFELLVVETKEIT